MLDLVVARYVTDNLQWFFDRYLKDHYECRRQLLNQLKEQHDVRDRLIPAIDYILQTCVHPEAKYPPESIELWHQYYSKLHSGHSRVFQQLLVLYLRLDLDNYLSIRERESKIGKQTRTKDKAELTFLQSTLSALSSIPTSFDFSSSIIKLSKGLWSLDNDHFSQMLSDLSDPSVELDNYFDSPKDIVQLILGTLKCQDKCPIALYISKIHRHDNWDEDYDQLHAYLLISSGQLVEALKYERMFMDQENYPVILQHFFELCSKLDVTKALNCLNLSVDEEEAWNEHLSSTDTQPISPSSGIHSQSNYQQATRQTSSMISTPARPTLMSRSTNKDRSKSTSKHTPRNRSVHALKKTPSFNDSPARNTRSARKKMGDN